MSKLSNAVEKINSENELRLEESVENFMGGDSYKINPLDTLKMISASSIFGEPSYYIGSTVGNKVSRYLKEHSVLPCEYDGMSTNLIMEDAIDKALSFDFKGTLEWAATLRNDFNMRLNPQVIMVRASIHPDRKKFTDEYKGLFNEINKKCMRRADEPLSQMTYYLYNNGGKKNNIPSIIKRSWAEKMSNLTSYEVSKYKNSEIGMINGVRICHATSKVIDELMDKGSVEVSESNSTWEKMRSSGSSWKEILSTVNVGHMALLRNLRGIFSEIDDLEICKDTMEKLKSGVKSGKQFPFRYYSALKAVRNSNCNHKPVIIDALEECIDISIENMPKLKGKTMCLSDNSGSAWGSVTSEYGTVTVAEIDNLSSVITAKCSDEGYVGKFGDRLIVTPVSKRNGTLAQADKITKSGSHDVGGATEGGIWEFFKNAINNKEHWDNIFIYSDQQAGHGGLYGSHRQVEEYSPLGYATDDTFYCPHINVFKLILEYRKKVNPKVNVFSVQTAGYDNSVIPEYAYRTNIMYGWTGKESIFADEMIKQWDYIESK